MNSGPPCSGLPNAAANPLPFQQIARARHVASRIARQPRPVGGLADQDEQRADPAERRARLRPQPRLGAGDLHDDQDCARQAQRVRHEQVPAEAMALMVGRP